MRVFFICGSLEPGRDGVGDYVRQLAKELQNHGHQVAAAAIYDEHIVKGFLRGGTNNNNGDFPSLRISRACSMADRFRDAKEFLDEFDPEWVSLQFVPFSFNYLGLTFGLGRHLNTIAPGRRWQIMFHELWVGMDQADPFKNIILGMIQKQLIMSVIAKLQPGLLHTHLPLYRTKLGNLGYNIKNLPLFSNIKMVARTLVNSERNILRVGFFSQVDSSRSIRTFLEKIVNEAVDRNMTCELWLIGGSIQKMSRFGNDKGFQTIFKNNIKCTGFLSSQELSQVLQTCDLGVTSVPRHALGKSGSVAAFLSHGVPVAAPNIHKGYNRKDIGFFSSSLCAAILLEPNLMNLEKAKKAALKARKEISLSTVTNTFLSDLDCLQPRLVIYNI